MRRLICPFKSVNQSREVGGIYGHRSLETKVILTVLQVQDCCNPSAKMLHKIINLTVRDVRFPTSLEQHGSDAMVRSNVSTRDAADSCVMNCSGSLHIAAHRPGLFGRICGDRHGLRSEGLRPHIHSGKRHGYR